MSEHRSLKARLLHELEEYGTVFLYLYVSFAAVIFYRDAVLRTEGIALASFGFAFVKALVLAKFMVIGQAARVGERVKGQRLYVNVLWRTTMFLILLGGLTVVEEALVGLAHGRAARDAVAEIGGGNLRELAATAVLLWLILLPYFALRLIGEQLGKGALRRMFFGRG